MLLVWTSVLGISDRQPIYWVIRPDWELLETNYPLNAPMYYTRYRYEFIVCFMLGVLTRLLDSPPRRLGIEVPILERKHLDARRLNCKISLPVSVRLWQHVPQTEQSG